MNPETVMQPNGAEEQLTPENRKIAEAYYASKGVGPTAKERYEHFRDDPELRPIYLNVLTGDQGFERLCTLEWMRWQWNGEI